MNPKYTLTQIARYIITLAKRNSFVEFAFLTDYFRLNKSFLQDNKGKLAITEELLNQKEVVDVDFDNYYGCFDVMLAK